MVKRTIRQEDITVINIYWPNIGAPKYIKQLVTYLKGDNKIIVGDFNTPLTSVY